MKGQTYCHFTLRDRNRWTPERDGSNMNIKRIFARLIAVPFAAAAVAAAPAHAEDIPVEKVANQGSSALVIGEEVAEYRQLLAQWRTEV